MILTNHFYIFSSYFSIDDFKKYQEDILYPTFHDDDEYDSIVLMNFMKKVPNLGFELIF